MLTRLRLIALPSLALLVFAAPAAANSVSLSLSKPGARHGQTVKASGAVSPALAQEVIVELRREGTVTELARGSSRADGTFELPFQARLPGLVVARTVSAESAPAGLGVRPVLELKLSGRRLPTAALRVRGRVLPAAAGSPKLRWPGASRSARLDERGRFAGKLAAGRPGRFCVRGRIARHAGFAATSRRACLRIGAPSLRVGSRGPAVRVLERRLRKLRYALRSANGYFGSDTHDALMAFQKVERIGRSGSATRSVWRTLPGARTPRPAGKGDYIEISKSKQLLMEVRNGRVQRVIHTSTGLTGNTPVGRFEIYRKDPGMNAIGMYYSLYFLGGFAIHGYKSVPPFPASHGCARVPLWLAHGLYSRWKHGDRVRVLR